MYKSRRLNQSPLGLYTWPWKSQPRSYLELGNGVKGRRVMHFPLKSGLFPGNPEACAGLPRWCAFMHLFQSAAWLFPEHITAALSGWVSLLRMSQMNCHAVLAWGLSQQEPIISNIFKWIRWVFHMFLAKNLEKVVQHSFATVCVADLWEPHHTILRSLAP